MKRTIVRSAVMALAGVGLLAGSAGATSLITNGDFSQGLDGWNQGIIPGGVSVVDVGGPWGNVAHLDDPTALGYETLYQSFYIAPGITSIDISFDYLLTGVDNSFLFDDSATATISILDDRTHHSAFWGLVQWTTEDWDTTVLGSISSSSPGYGTIGHFQGTVDVSGIYDWNPNAILRFNLYEMFSICGLDSDLYLDNVNVSITGSPNDPTAPVPEPATMLLMGTGIAGLFAARRRKSARS